MNFATSSCDLQSRFRRVVGVKLRLLWVEKEDRGNKKKWKQQYRLLISGRFAVKKKRKII